MKLVLPFHIDMALKMYIRATPLEISGLGEIVVGKGELILTRLHLFEQECSYSVTELDQEAVAKFLLTWIEQKKDTSALKLWWHSHAKMKTFWSTTDQETARGFSSDWMVSLVGNHDGDYLVRLDFWTPLELTVTIPTEVRPPESTKMLELIKADVASKVKEKKITYGATGYSVGGSHGFQGYPARSAVVLTRPGETAGMIKGLMKDAAGRWEWREMTTEEYDTLVAKDVEERQEIYGV